MGVLRNTWVADDCRMGLWQIEEDFATLFGMVSLDEAEIRRMNLFRSGARQLESLSVRALLQAMTTPEARIVYNEQRKPFLRDGSRFISITHSNRYTAILLSSTRHVGIDLEYMSHRIERVAQKFIHPDEYITTVPSLQQTHLYIHWCAKEALFKICDKQNLNFQENMVVSPFEISPDGRGDIVGRVENENRHETFQLHYELLDNYVIVYTVKQMPEGAPPRLQMSRTL